MLNALILFLTIVTLNLNASKKMRILKADQRMTIQPRKHEKEFRDPIEDCLLVSATLAETFTLLLS